MAKTILLAGGGTAGHVNPLLATAAELQDRGHTVVALGTAEGLESELVPLARLEFRLVPRVPMPRRPGLGLLRFPGRMRAAIHAARAAIDEVKPDAVVGFGGYVSTPAYLAARKANVPVVVHEANARAGLANRLGARFAAGVAVTFEGTGLSGEITTGMPLRPGIAALASARREPESHWLARAQARKSLGWDMATPAALIMGGSLGAASINSAVVNSIESLVSHGITVLHLTGAGKAIEAERAFGALPARLRPHYVVREYMHDMNEAFAAVDAVVCRSGSGTVAEVSALCLPALYVPLPIGNGEQALNARLAVDAGAATLVADERFGAAALQLGLERMLLEPGTNEDMAMAALTVGIVDGATRLSDMIEDAAL